ncbi:phBC6A51 family helix-turn-helix protein [Paenibacillus chibensis]|uniref:phBC6A51 family helix-turn-helix protein n=1 Tax=Paenibacillus chibensis TaxID=59846 RepID=UPI000FD8B53A|nr:phBC6A51 family helix-turn-helix protein [Paenibacillus chibensis]MEC0370036.1 phBC6A51 family helix-turn-helix protein [Paenibacillus chibensis]
MSDKKKSALEARLEGRQIKAALLCVEREFAPEDERKSFDEIADEVGVSRMSLFRWRTGNRAFIDYVNHIADDFLASERALVYRQLMKTITGPQPSVKGIDLYFKRHGLITQQVAVESKDAGTTRTNEEIAQELEELDELLAEGDGEE